MNLDDTIVAIATPPGRGGIGVVRIAGPQAVAIVRPMLRLSRDLEPNHATLADLIDPRGDSPSGDGLLARSAEQSSAIAKVNDRIDEVVVTYFAAPHSYTTDDIVEISAHGSPVVLRHIVELALARGARLAEPGEFTMRAFLNGRLDLTQAEAVRDLIDAQTLFQAKVAAQQLEGALSNRLKPIKKNLIDLIALLEAGIDFAEDDVSVAKDDVILKRIEAVRSPLEQLAKSFTYGKLVREGLTLAIVGRPNVGKSSLFNRLVERDRAIVTAQPGTTRDLVTETVAIEGIPVHLIDTAGIRESKDEAESAGIRKSIEALADADLILLVIDKSQRPREEEAEEEGAKEEKRLRDQIEGRSAIIVENKSDLTGAGVGDFPARALAAGSAPIIRTSAVTGEGIVPLRAAIFKQIAGDSTAQQEAGFLTNVRHEKLVQDALAGLSAATGAVASKIPHEMLLLDIYAALRPLDEITGATSADDILNLIFGTFCIGK